MLLQHHRPVNPHRIVLAATAAGVWFAFAPAPCGAQSNAAPGEYRQMSLSTSESQARVLHRTIDVGVKYQRFTSALESVLGRFASDVQQDIVSRPQIAEQRIEAMAGEQGLMIFGILDHGAALNMVGAPRNAKQYLIGNPLTAIQMTRHDLRAALYAPLRVLAYESADGRTLIEYDQPSSLFGQFGNAEVTAVGVSLDQKLEAVIRRAAELSR
jgi:uncharacterized protein (DUF302 family)